MHHHSLSSHACLALASAVVLAGCNAVLSPPTRAPVASHAPASTSEAQWISRGEYITRIAGCNDCHTPGYGERSGEVPKEEWLVGSPVGYHGPWGTTYAANLRLKAMEMDEPRWMKYTGELHTRPIMPDFNVRAMHEDDRRAMYRFIRSLGTAGGPAPAYLPPGQTPPVPYFQLVLPPPPAGAPATIPTG